MKHIVRKLSESVLFSLGNTPVVFLNGPRQAGKSTLVQTLAQAKFPADYISFDNATQLGAATASPENFLRQRQGATIIDEVQMVPTLFRPLKVMVDEQRIADKANSNGRFLLTGSANIMALPKLSDPLVGRMSVKTLYPFAASEVFGGSGRFLEDLFCGKFSSITQDYTLNEAIQAATFPEISCGDSRVAGEWFDGYVTTILQRDVRMITELEKIGLLPALLRILASRAGGLMNDAEIARDIGLNPVTSKSYRSVLQAMFLSFDIQPWYRNIGKRLIKAPKGYIIDTLLLCHFLGWDLEDLKDNRPHLYGHVVENFVATELLKLLSFSDIRANLLHFRTSDGREVDFVLERPDGSLVGIEVKTSDRLSAKDFKGLKTLQEVAGKDFICGIILYAGKDIISFGENLYAVPFSALWS